MDRIRLNASEWMDFRSGEKKCFLLTNGLGGYCSLTVMGNAARNDQALLMGALKAPTVREHLISNVWETLEVDGEETELFSQEFVNRTQNVEGFRFLEGFEMGSLPVWFYRVKGIEIEKTIGMVQGENTVLVRYRVRSGKKGSFSVRPVMRFAAKGEQLQEGQNFAVDRKCIASNGVILSYGTNGELQMEKERIWRDLFFEQDARDGRDGIGSAVVNHRIRFEMTGDGREQVFFVVYSLADDVDKWDEERIALWIEEEEKRQEMIAEKSGISDPVGKRLAVSASQVILDDAPLLEMRADGMTLGQKIIKRGADIVLSALALLVLSPLMLLIALAIRVEDGGNVIFRQKRLTADGKTFTICKFRTMRRGSGGASARDADDRVTHVGRFLRRWRLDELPQFWNILRGDMSLVGPRPEMLENITRYKRDLPEFQFRERMKAGLTGYAQIEGRYNTSPEDKLALDLFYIEGFSLWTDMKLLLRTVTVFFRPDATQGFPPEDSSFIPKHDKTQEEEQ